MPIRTPRVGIPYFGRGELYSATTDAARMLLLDAQFKVIWDVVGDGIINGIETEKVSNSEVSISPGTIMISGKVSRLSHGKNLLIESDGDIYVRKIRDFGGFGLFSNVYSFGSYIYPSMGELGAQATVNEIDQVVISWSKPVWCDFVRIYRTVIGDVKELIATSYSDTYIDLSAPKGADVEYFISAIQYDGIVNGITSLGIVSVPPSLDPPLPLSNVVSGPIHRGIYVSWDVPVSQNTSTVEINIRSIDGQVYSDEVPANSGFISFVNLEINFPYYADVYAISASGIYSAVKTVFSIPIFSQGPLSPSQLRLSVERDSVSSLSFIDFSWSDPVTDSASADPDSPGQIDDASGNYTAYNMIRLTEMSADGLTANFVGEEFEAQGVENTAINELKYRTASGELVSRAIQANSRYIVSIRRLVNGRYSPRVESSIKTGNLGLLSPPSSGTAIINEDASISAVWSFSSNSAAIAYRVSLSKAEILSKTISYSVPPYEAAGIVRSELNVFDFFRFDISGSKITLRIIATDQLASLASLSILRSTLEFTITPISTFKDVEKILNSAVPIISLSGNIITFNQLFKFMYSDPNKLAKDMIPAFDVEPSQSSAVSSQALGPEYDFDPNGNGMSLISYYIYYYGGAKIYAVDDIETATYSESVSLGEFSEVPLNPFGDYVTEVVSNAFETEGGIALPNNRYRFSVYSVDASGNESSSMQFYADSPAVYEIAAPRDPEMLHTEIHGGAVELIWTPSKDDVKGYVIYRKIGSGYFSEIAKLESSNNFYMDIGVPVDVNIVYVIKSLSVWGLGLFSPDPSNYLQMTYSTARLVGADFNQNAISLSVLKSGFNAILSWTASDEYADGYQIWARRPGEVFKLVDSVSSNVFTYTHTNALLLEGIYNYSVRPVRGEIEVNFSSSASVPGDAFIISRVSFDQQGSLNIENISRNIGRGLDMVGDSVAPRLSSHRHIYLPDGQDRRVDLKDYFDLSNFTMIEDGVRFTHINPHSPIPEGASLSVWVNGSPYIGDFSYNEVTRTITFARNILRPIGVYNAIDSIVLRVSNVSEVDGSLESENVLELYGEQISSGSISQTMVPDISHAGRRDELCPPMTASCSSSDGFKFLIESDEDGYNRYVRSNSLGNADDYAIVPPGVEPPNGFELLQKAGFPLGNSSHVVVYDGCELFPDDSMILATSLGTVLLTGIEGSINWETYIPCNPPTDIGPPHKIRISTQRDFISVLHPRGVDILRYVQGEDSADAIRQLYVVSNALGIDLNAKFMRDICATSFGFMVTSDLGPISIFIKQDDIPYADFMTLPDASDSETYACCVDGDRLFVSNKNGIFLSQDSGDTWYLFAITDNIVRSMIINENFIFAISDYTLMRISKLNGDIEVIHENENLNARYRKLDFFQNRITIVGDTGCIINDPVYSIYFSSDIKFLPVKNIPKFSKMSRACRSIFKYRNEICIGGDAFLSKSSVITRLKTVIDFSNYNQNSDRSKIPTVYVNNLYRENGSYLEYSPNRFAPECIYFDEQLEGSDRVSVARQYTSRTASGGGWAWRDFSAPVVVKVNGEPINDGSRAEKPVDQLLALVENELSLSDLFSDSSGAAIYFNDMKNVIAEMTNNDSEITDNPQSVGVHRFTRANVRRFVNAINNLNSKIYSDTAMNLMGIRQSFIIKTPQFRTNLIANFVSNGVSRESLDRRSMAYSSYGPESCVGSLGTYDPEDMVMLAGEIPIASAIDGSDNPIYTDSDVDLSRVPSPSGDSSILISGYFSRPNNASQGIIQPSPPGSLDGLGGGNNSSSSSVAPPGDGDIGV